MSNDVKISNLSVKPCLVDVSGGVEPVVDTVLEHLDRSLQCVLPDRPDLVVLPEACDRPQNLAPERRIEYYLARGTRILDYLREQASQNQCYIAYSAARQDEKGAWRNATQIIDRHGNIAGIYNKNHLTIGEFETGGVRYGTEVPVITCDFGRVVCAICFDLNFDRVRQLCAAAHPDLVLFSSMYHGGMMQAYWAYTCRAHFVGAIGGKGSAGSILSPLGETIARTTNYFDHVTATVNLDCCVAHLDYNAPKLVELKKHYGPDVNIRDPGCLGSVLISSRTDRATAREMAAEFEIELLDDYFVRALQHRDDHCDCP